MIWRKPAATSESETSVNRVLVIQLGGVAAFVQALAAARRIRDAHIGAHITLLSVDLDRVREPGAALEAALARRGPCLIHATLDTDLQVLPMVPPGAANREMVGA
jgi:thiamine pyrophosphate-dependent acetolactate synthase large subunit-like protein